MTFFKKSIPFLLIIALLCAGLWKVYTYGTEKLKSIVEERFYQKTALTLHIESLSYHPWKGLILKNLRCELPKALLPLQHTPLLNIKSIHAQLQLRTFFSKQSFQTLQKKPLHAFRSLEIKEPKLTISTELLAALLPQSPTLPDTPTPTKPTPKPPHLEPTPTKPSPKLPQPTPTPTKPRKSPPTIPLLAPPPQLAISIHNAHLVLESSFLQKTLLEGSGISLQLPPSLQNPYGNFSCKTLHLLEIPLTKTPIKCPLLWKKKNMLATSTPQIQAQILTQSPFLFAIKSGGEITPFDYQTPERGALKISQLLWTFQASGQITTPASWRTKQQVLAQDIHYTPPHLHQRLDFTSLHIDSSLTKGLLRWKNSKILGNEISLLSNGYLSPQGKSDMILRFIPSENFQYLSQRALLGVKGLSPYNSSWWERLNESSLPYRDLRIWRNKNTFYCDMGSGHKTFTLLAVYQAIRTFIQEEINEEL